MADNLTDTAENLMLDWVNGVGSPSRPTPPLKLALLTANGSDSAAGTEVVGGSYARPTVVVGAASGGATSNTNLIEVTDMPACTVTGVAVYDSAGSPLRIWHGTLSSSKTVNAGDTFQIPIGDLDLVLG